VTQPLLLSFDSFETEGSRVFDIVVKSTVDKTTLADIDMVKIAGQRYMPFERKVKVVVVGGVLTVKMISKPNKDWPSIAGIEVHRLGDAVPVLAPVAPPMAAPVFSTIRIACGREDPYTDKEGKVWSIDKYFNQGNPYFAPWLAIDDTEGTQC
jgi:hypothetical protein